ncbi:MAG TPA: shikimate dehydrogenase [Spirochaetales bacterium]|nr:shikimate dehydrogenase [Spirochaetales bacterium]MBP7262972.1 shikimate dehydrogenase [Spirochaetia bacterium]HPE35865.1 shikimate dehydrogenase [Spirochaetales bacterium]
MPKICLCLTGPTIEKNLEALDRYRKVVDLVELRADFLEPQEMFRIRSFPEKAGLPTILTVRRLQDGGRFDQGEGVRLVIIAKGLAFADQDKRKNFAYVDIEHDLQIPAIQEAARIFGTKVIRSIHCRDGVPANLPELWSSLSSSPFEIPKLAAHARGIEDTERLFRFFGSLETGERIVTGMGDYGFCTRILPERLGSMLVYASATGAGLKPGAPGQLDPDVLRKQYRLGSDDASVDLYGILGSPSVLGSLSPHIHNAGFAELGIDARYLPFPADDLDAFMRLAELLDIKGLSVTVPFKERVLSLLGESAMEVAAIGACNTMVRSKAGWAGYNTDAMGFRSALLHFLGRTELKGLRACIVGAGGAARSVAYTLHGLGVEACVINRSLPKAKRLAEEYGFPWAGMTERAVELIESYNDLIVQTTSVGMEGGQPGDPLDWYQFSGGEALFETIYNPAETVLLKRARDSGCRVTNGHTMLLDQAAAQFRLFTGQDYPDQVQL